MLLRDFTSEEKILNQLCQLRIKLAAKRNKKHLIHIHTKDPVLNYHNSNKSADEKLLDSLFPPRRKWKTLKPDKRRVNGLTRTSASKSLESLRITICYFRKYSPEEKWLIKLDWFIRDIQNSILSGNHNFSKPKIIPKLKEDKMKDDAPNICRPIASYGLKDKLIIGITNKYLTYILESVFFKNSFAFRAKRDVDGIVKVPDHHDCFHAIQMYRDKFPPGSLFVAECDMKKFFDTVNHSIIKRQLRNLLKRKDLNAPAEDIKVVWKLVCGYLDSYTFNKDVFPKNDEQSYFQKYKIKWGEFEWVKQDIHEHGYYKRIKSAKIGIPQGGALSGLLANVVLHNVDRQILRNKDANMLYLRFCDDMILMHNDIAKCNLTFETYIRGLRNNKLIPHPPDPDGFSSKRSFWKCKSKKTYSWSNNNAGSPWVGFVGYEIHYFGMLRVRKSSLKKEMAKQYKIVGELRQVAKNTQYVRSSYSTLKESLLHRLIGMSVGRIDLWNYDTVPNEMCWVSGFRLLTDNIYVRNQLRRLDRSRGKLIYKFDRFLNAIEKENPQTESDDNIIRKIRQEKYYGYPYSYYYQILHNKNDENEGTSNDEDNLLSI